MASIVPGCEYDIFISYRHNDNRSSWVTEFVSALQEELAATLKEPVSVYFDTNPHDGLLETHNVDKSLEGKLKCLIFIPIISQTYCDPKSFAWQHEFAAFNKMTKEDQFGRDIRLASGNVASRILPVKIHDLDPEDKTLLENELGGVLRYIEFIYKTAGVNRPLYPSDSPDRNFNKTYYRDQVNKIANAVKEIIYGLKNSSSFFGKSTQKDFSVKFKSNPEPFESIAVLPFANMSSDPEQEFFSDGISEEIINMLAQVPGLKVAGRTSAFSFKGKNLDLRLIGEQLNVNHILEGSVRKSGNKIRITAQLIKVTDGYHLWAEKFDRELEDIFDIQDEISLAIVEELKIKLFEEVREQILKSKTQNLEAYNYYLKGRFHWNNSRTKEGIEKTIKYFEKAGEADPNFALAFAGLALAYTVLADWGFIQTKVVVPKIKELLIKSRELDNTLAENHVPLIYTYSLFEWDWQKAEMESRKAFGLNPKSPEVHHFYALVQMCLGNFKNAIEHNKRARELDPFSSIFNFAFGLIQYMSRQYDDAIIQFRKTLEIDNSFAPAYYWTSLSYLQKGLYIETIEEFQNFLLGDTMIEKYVSAIDDIFKKSGLEGFLQWLVDEGIGLGKGIYNQPYHLAVCYALLNNKDMAFEYLGEACEKHVSWVSFTKVDPGFDNLRGDPRFSIFLGKLGLQ